MHIYVCVCIFIYIMSPFVHAGTLRQTAVPWYQLGPQAFEQQKSKKKKGPQCISRSGASYTCVHILNIYICIAKHRDRSIGSVHEMSVRGCRLSLCP